MPLAGIPFQYAAPQAQVRHDRVSTNRQFIAEVRDLAGLYLDPPDKTLVLCVGEKSQIQAVGRTAPRLPMESRIGHSGHCRIEGLLPLARAGPMPPRRRNARRPKAL